MTHVGGSDKGGELKWPMVGILCRVLVKEGDILLEADNRRGYFDL